MSIETVAGHCEPRFEAVREAFSRLMSEPGERGASISLYWRGEQVVNLWAGTRDKAATLPWEQDTLVNVFSTTKGVAAIAVHKAVELGLLDLEKPVAYYWPEYGREGKKDTLVAWILNHRAGQPAIRKPLADEALFDWDYMASALAREAPWWQPGASHGYHPVTFGWLIGEVFRRAEGVTLGKFLQTEIAGPLALDMYLGVPDGELGRISDLAAASKGPLPGRVHLFDKIMSERDSMTSKSLINPMSQMSSSNTRAWRQMELPSANLHSTAAALATLYGKLACREGVLSDNTLTRCREEESVGDDPVLCTHTRFGQGFMLQQPGHIEGGFGPGLQAFGHPGSGGSLAFADPERGLGFAYVMNQMGPYVLVDPRPRALVEAVYGCLASR